MQRYMFDATVMVVCFALLGFFGWHASYGPRGFDNQNRLIARVVELENDHSGIKARREALDGRVALLRPETIDPDMLDEAARRTLGFADANDLIVR